MEGVTLPSDLQTLTFGDGFDQSLDCLEMVSALECLCMPEVSISLS